MSWGSIWQPRLNLTSLRTRWPDIYHSVSLDTNQILKKTLWPYLDRPNLWRIYSARMTYLVTQLYVSIYVYLHIQLTFKFSDLGITLVILPSTGTCIFSTFSGSNTNSITLFLKKNIDMKSRGSCQNVNLVRQPQSAQLACFISYVVTNMQHLDMSFLRISNEAAVVHVCFSFEMLTEHLCHPLHIRTCNAWVTSPWERRTHQEL